MNEGHISDRHVISLKILQISDIHVRVGSDLSDLRPELDVIPDRTLDMIAVTGDLIQHTDDMMKGTAALTDAVRFIKSLKLKLKSGCQNNIFVVPGNHDATSAFIESELGKPDSQEYGMFKEHLIEGDLTADDLRINDRRFSYQSDLTDLVFESDIMVNGVHRLVRGEGVNVVMLNTEYLYLPGSGKDPKFYKGNIDEIAKKLQENEFWTDPVVVIGHRDCRAVSNTNEMSESIGSCRALFYLSGHKHDYDVEKRNEYLGISCPTLNLTSDGSTAGFAVLEWCGDRVSVEPHLAEGDGKSFTEPTPVYRYPPSPFYDSIFHRYVNNLM